MDQSKTIEKAMIRSYALFKYVWPTYRQLVKHKLAKRCTVCSLNEHATTIRDTICDTCKQEAAKTKAVHDSTSASAPGEQSQGKALETLLKSAQGTGRGIYDALLFFSGGKDSAYLLHRLKTTYPGLRILALTIDNGFRSPIGKQNAEKICMQLDVDHMELRPYQIFKKLYKYGIENFSHHGFICTDIWGGELFQDIGRNLAADMKIPLLILGYTPEQIEFLPEQFDDYQLYHSKDFKFKDNQQFTREKFADIGLADIFSAEDMRYWWDASKCSADDIPTMVFPFQAWGYHKAQMTHEVVSLLQETIDEKNMHPMLTNDLYIGLGIFLDYKILGYSPYEYEFSRYVREGKEDVNKNCQLWQFVEQGAMLNEKLLLNAPNIQACLNRLGFTEDTLTDIIQNSKARIGQ